MAALGVAAVTLVVSLAELRSQRATLDTLRTTLATIRQSLPGGDQRWFWTAEWQAGESEADAQIAANETTFFGSDEEFLAALEARIGQPATSERS